jgi:hypothetical protein
MGTETCPVLGWENRIWVTGPGNKRHKKGNGKTLIPK